jgi:hypothetical protein
MTRKDKIERPMATSHCSTERGVVANKRFPIGLVTTRNCKTTEMRIAQ